MVTVAFLLILFHFLLLRSALASEETEEEPEDRELEVIMEKLTSDDPFMRSEVIDYLSYCSHPKAFELLTNSLKDPDWAVRKDAVTALGSMADLKAVKYIAELLTDEYWHVRKEVIRVVGLLGGKDAIEPLMSLLSSEDELIKSSAQKALVKVGNKAIEGMLSKRINDRWNAAKTLGALKDKRPLPLLLEAIKIEKDAKVKNAIQEAIEILSNLPSEPQVPPPPAESQEDITVTEEIAVSDFIPSQETVSLPQETVSLPQETVSLPQETVSLSQVSEEPATKTQDTIKKPDVPRTNLDKEVDAFLASLDEE
ncbi:MAG: HEAT repeat protein [bacterium ADurb.Bin363]|nr:MAG: HEAT repeat protein [bacterium ADurb.Bin363]